MSRRLPFVLLFASACLAPAAASGQCVGSGTTYQGVTPVPGVTNALGPGRVDAFVQYDPDGFNTGGPNLMIVGGNFQNAGPLTNVAGLAAWNGATFVHLGTPGQPNRPSNPFRFAVVPSGPAVGLYAVSTQGVHRFNNGVWTIVTSTVPSALISWDPDQGGPGHPNLVYAFTSAGGQAQVVRWDGVSPNPITETLAVLTRAGGGASVSSLTIYDPDGAGFAGDWLVYAGWFEQLNGAHTVGHMAAATGFNTGGFSALGGGMNNRIYSITGWKRGTPNNALAMVGMFTAPRLGGAANAGGAIYDGFNYSPMATNMLPASNRIGTWDPDGPGGSPERLIVNCLPNNFTRAGVYAYVPGSLSFEILGNGGIDADVFGVWDVVGNRSQPEWVFAGGDFVKGGHSTSGSVVPGTTRLNSIARMRPIANSGSTHTDWLPLPNEGVPAGITSVGIANVDRSLGGSDRLYVYGGFQEIGGMSLPGLARSSGTNPWQAAGTPTGAFWAFARFRPGTSPFTNDTLYAGGNVLARMNAALGDPISWTNITTLGSGQTIRAMLQFDPDGSGPIPTSVLVGGTFTTIGGIAANRIAYYTPSTNTWGTIGSGFNGPVNAFALFDFDGNGPGTTRLVAGGEFTTAGGVPASRLAYWDGVQWFPMPDGGPNGPVYALAAQNQLTNNPAFSRLYVGGAFSAVGSRPCANVAYWQNTTPGVLWSDMSQGVNGAVTAIALVDLNGTQNSDVERNGPEVIIGGRFTASPQPGRPAIRGLARYGPEAQWNPILDLYPTGTNTTAEVVAITPMFPLTPGGRPRILVAGTFAAGAPDAPLQNLAAIQDSDPYIAAAPATIPEACAGETVTFTVQAEGPGLVYRWQKSFANLFPGATPHGSVLSGVDGPTLTITNAQNQDAGAYRCVVTNSCRASTSNFGYLTSVVQCGGGCGSADFDCDGDIGTDADIEAFFACLAGACPPAPCASSADFNGDGDIGTDADIEAFFRVLAGGPC
jgi:hypothetical protein